MLSLCYHRQANLTQPKLLKSNKIVHCIIDNCIIVSAEAHHQVFVVGAVMALIRECQPKTFEEWQQYYFDRAHTKTKVQIKVTREILDELGERLYAKITEVVIPEWTEAFNQITKQDCYDYVYEVTIPRTYDGFITEKSVINDSLTKKFPDIKFEESDSDLDHAGDVDYIGRVGNKAFGIQIKPVTENANFGNYKLTERMQANFESF